MADVAFAFGVGATAVAPWQFAWETQLRLNKPRWNHGGRRMGGDGKNEWVSMFALSIKYTKTKSEIYINISTLFSPCALAH